MKSVVRFLLFVFLPAITVSSVYAQDRPMYSAGKFYTADSSALTKELAYLFSKAENRHPGNVLALISPHAGYSYSGEVAATSFVQLNPGKKYDNIFLIGSSHTMYLDGASVYAGGDYLTPLGRVEVNKVLANRLIEKNKYFSFVPQAHLHEHSLENQLPFLQYYLKKEFKIVPVIIGTDDDEVLKSIAATLEPYFNQNNLFVISSDFSHYPRYNDAQKADSMTAQAILKNSVKAFKEALKTNALKRYPGLVTSACGHSSIEVLLYITQKRDDIKYIPLMYRNSGDVPMGDKGRVVGYFSIAAIKTGNKGETSILNEAEKRVLLKLARETLEKYILTGKYPAIERDFPEALKVHSGAFVTLKESGNLRGCIGRFVTSEPLYKTVMDMTVAAATQDYRFPPVEKEELDKIDIEISVLTPLKRINSVDEIVLGRDGIYMIKGNRHGTFLPQVATETGWNKEEFLGHCARDKAGIGWEGWKTADLYIYQAVVFSEKESGKN
jgi:AmmeMemoRadiSam system protein B/AmmeMemoRadiSam system protein A